MGKERRARDCGVPNWRRTIETFMPSVTIIGAGLAGLSCALRLHEIGIPFQIVEASDAVGGRVRTDEYEGFRLDRGFQVLLTAYPEAQRSLDFVPLDLREFERGALIRRGAGFTRVADPRKHLLAALGSILRPFGTFRDTLQVLSLIHKTRVGKLADQFAKPEGLTLDFLRWHGFSDTLIDGLFRPLFGGIFLERDLVTSSRMFRFVFRMLAGGEAAVPNRGMGEIPQQLAARLPANTIRLNAAVNRLELGRITLSQGETIESQAVIVATEAPSARRLLGDRARFPNSRAATCMYFAADRSPVGEPILVLNADEPGPVNHLAVMSDVATGYAPPGAALISVSILGIPTEDDSRLEAAVRDQLAGWYGQAVRGWRHLRTYRIEHALPEQTAPALDPIERPVALGDGLFVCGDHRDNASIHGAMASGWRAAQAVAAALE